MCVYVCVCVRLTAEVERPLCKPTKLEISNHLAISICDCITGGGTVRNANFACPCSSCDNSSCALAHHPLANQCKPTLLCVFRSLTARKKLDADTRAYHQEHTKGTGANLNSKEVQAEYAQIKLQVWNANGCQHEVENAEVKSTRPMWPWAGQ